MKHHAPVTLFITLLTLLLLTGCFFSDNNDFFNGNKREQKPLYALQSHVVRTFPDGWWASVGLAYGWSGESKINGEDKNDRRGDAIAQGDQQQPGSREQQIEPGHE